MGVFDELLSIKRFREGKAELSVRQQRQTYLRALASEQQARLNLDDFRVRAQAQEADMYRDLCSRLVRVRAIDEVLLSVASLKEGERQMIRALDDAIAQTKRDTIALDDARRHHQHARMKVEKFVELAQSHDAMAAAQREHRSDLDMEEAASVTREREAWAMNEEIDSI